jgi:hypothetical protein
MSNGLRGAGGSWCAGQAGGAAGALARCRVRVAAVTSVPSRARGRGAGRGKGVPAVAAVPADAGGAAAGAGRAVVSDRASGSVVDRASTRVTRKEIVADIARSVINPLESRQFGQSTPLQRARANRKFRYSSDENGDGVT